MYAFIYSISYKADQVNKLALNRHETGTKRHFSLSDITELTKE